MGIDKKQTGIFSLFVSEKMWHMNFTLIGSIENILVTGPIEPCWIINIFNEIWEKNWRLKLKIWFEEK